MADSRTTCLPRIKSKNSRNLSAKTQIAAQEGGDTFRKNHEMSSMHSLLSKIRNFFQQKKTDYLSRSKNLANDTSD